MPQSTASRFGATDDEVVEYRAVSPLAVVGLIVGIASTMTLVGRSLWCLSVLGVLLNAGALLQIWQRSPALLGRRAAVWGLALSTLFLFYLPAENFFFHHFLAREARQEGQAWFQAVARKDPAGVHRLMLDPRIAVGPKTQPELYYRANPKAGEALRRIVDEPLMRTLFALGPLANARYYETVSYESSDTSEVVYQNYAVTFDENKLDPSATRESSTKQVTTFFVTVALERLMVGDQKAKWHVVKVEGPIRPSGWGT